MSSRANQLADRIEAGAALLAAFARPLSDGQWHTVVPPDGRSVGVLVHHVANMYPIEVQVIQRAMTGEAITDVSWTAVAAINSEHAHQFAAVTKADALALLAKNSQDAVRFVRALSDEELDRAVPFSLSYGAPVTVQFIIEDHPLRHPWHHLERMRRALGLSRAALAGAA